MVAPGRETDDAVEREAVKQVDDIDGVLLGALLHDVGKVGAGGHVEIGIEVAARTLAAMGVAEATRDLAGFMVAQHLLLPDTATRRDLTDDDLILDVAAAIGTPSRLAALYLLAKADAAATGPAAWTPWRRSLIRELVAKVQRVFDRGEMGMELAERLADRVGRLRDLLDRRARGRGRAVRAADAARLLPERRTRPRRPALRRHRPRRRVARGARRDGAGNEAGDLRAPRGGRPTGRVCSRGSPERWRSRACRSSARRSSPRRTASRPTCSRSRAPSSRRWGSDAGASSAPRCARRSRGRSRSSAGWRRSAATTRPDPTTPVTVAVDNAASDFFTVIEVGAPDRIGLLHDITAALAELRLDVHLAKVTTYTGRVIDAFYVRDALGGKVDRSGAGARGRERGAHAPGRVRRREPIPGPRLAR